MPSDTIPYNDAIQYNITRCHARPHKSLQKSMRQTDFSLQSGVRLKCLKQISKQPSAACTCCTLGRRATAYLSSFQGEHIGTSSCRKFLFGEMCGNIKNLVACCCLRDPSGGNNCPLAGSEQLAKL